MSGNLNNGFELFPFHLVGKFSRTEAKYLLLLIPMYFAILTAILEAWLLRLTSLCPPIPAFLFCHNTPYSKMAATRKKLARVE